MTKHLCCAVQYLGQLVDRPRYLFKLGEHKHIYFKEIKDKRKQFALLLVREEFHSYRQDVQIFILFHENNRKGAWTTASGPGAYRATSRIRRNRMNYNRCSVPI